MQRRRSWSEPPTPRRDPPVINFVNVNAIVKMIGQTVDRWPGNCFFIATLCVEYGCVQGKSVYGHYVGGVDAGSPQFGGSRAALPFRHHGWVETPDGRIYDPTHWCFGPRGLKPRVRITTVDDPDYDKGGNKVTAMFRRPPPEFDKRLPLVSIRGLDDKLKAFVLCNLDMTRTEITHAQAGWIASTPLDQLGDLAKPLFEWIMDFCPALIPLDNRMEVLGK